MITDSINEALNRGAHPEEILGEIAKQNPDVGHSINEGLNRGADPAAILQEITRQNSVDQHAINKQQGLADQQKYSQEAQTNRSLGGSISQGLAAGVQAAQNYPGDVIGAVKGAIGAVTHPIQTVQNIAGGAVAAAKAAPKAIAGAVQHPVQTFDNALGQASQYATQHPFQTGSAIYGGLQAGAGLLGKTEALNSATQTLGRTVTTPVKAAGRAVTDLTASIPGTLTGVGANAIKEAFTAGYEGGNRNESFTNALRGNTSAEHLVADVKAAAENVKEARRVDYRNALETTLKGAQEPLVTEKVQPILDKFHEQLNNFRVGLKNGELDFSKSTLFGDKAAMANVQDTYDIIKNTMNKPDGVTALDLDTMKHQLDNLYENGQSGAFTHGLRSSVQNTLETHIPGYQDLTKNYSEASGFLNDLRKNMSVGGTAGTETILKKVTGTMRDNNEFRQQLLQQLQERGKKVDISAKAAGVSLSNWKPQGFIGKGADVVNIFHGIQTGFTPAALGEIAATSPRLIGEFVHALGVGARPAKAIIQALNDVNNFKIPAAAANYIKNPKVGMSLADATKSLHPDDKNLLQKFIDYARLKKPLEQGSQENVQLEISARHILESVGKNPNKPNAALANDAEELLSRIKQGPTKQQILVRKDGKYNGSKVIKVKRPKQ